MLKKGSAKSPALAWCFAFTALACAPEAGGRSAGGIGGRAATARGPVIAASVYPLSFLVRSAAGPHATVIDLTKPGFEPHDAELTPGQIRAIARADLVVYLGGHFQPVVERAVAGMGGRAMDVLPTAHSMDEHGKGAETGAGGHVHSDPHVWLDPLRMRLINREIAARLLTLYPAAGPSVSSRAAELDAQLDMLHRAFSAGLKSCRRREVMTGHGAFGYLADRYDLEQSGIGAGFAEQEPTPGRMARLVQYARTKGIRTVFSERSTSPASARTLAREIQGSTALLDSIESAPPAGDYISAMKGNLAALRKGLACR